MEFNQKLQELRKQKGLTQEELALSLYVSRTAISKWESGKGYPSIDSLKAISKFFGVTVDELLSGDEILTIAENEGAQKENHIRDLIYGLLDISIAMFFFLPFFGQTAEGITQEVSLLGLTTPQPWLIVLYFAVVIGSVLTGILTLAMQSCTRPLWVKGKTWLSLSLNIIGTFLFIISRQPYAAAFTLVYLIIKALMLIKKH